MKVFLYECADEVDSTGTCHPVCGLSRRGWRWRTLAVGKMGQIAKPGETNAAAVAIAYSLFSLGQSQEPGTGQKKPKQLARPPQQYLRGIWAGWDHHGLLMTLAMMKMNEWSRSTCRTGDTRLGAVGLKTRLGGHNKWSSGGASVAALRCMEQGTSSWRWAVESLELSDRKIW